MRKPIAIVGFAFRLPGTDRARFWGDLTAGRDLVSHVPESRWAQEAYLHPDRSSPGTSYSFAAGTIGEVAEFDAAFFGISPREAEQMDPQQRLLLELTWEAFEHAGIKPSSVRGSRASVYIGFSGSDYSYRRTDDLASCDASTMTGNTASIAANRLSYWFDLRGPSMAVDTACSSTMVAFHQACQSLHVGESRMAVAGGISLHLHPMAFVGFSKASMLSPSGRCRVFDAAADGYVRAEGAGIFLLKPLDVALADDNRIYAVVAGSGVNCDGRTKGLTVPSWERQADLLREVYADAGVRPGEIDYVETHGTGTAVGDPIETRALGAALGDARPDGQPLLIGSVKSNVGHLEAAAAVAGLVKAIACLEHRSVPPTLHLERLNPNIHDKTWNLRAVTKNTPLGSGRQLVIGVNSFGFGGANAHVVLRSWDGAGDRLDVSERDVDHVSVPLLLSGRGLNALRAVAGQYAALLKSATTDRLYDIAYTAYLHRDLHDQRAMVYGCNTDDAVVALEAYANGKASVGIHEGEALPGASRPVFVYTGNGSQWPGMGRALLAESSTFAARMAELDALFSRHSDFALLDTLQRDDLEQVLPLTEVAQPLLFAVQVGVTGLMRELGLRPGAVVGHSVGEVAAAWASGALSLEQAVRLILARSEQQGRTKGGGAMLAVGMGAGAIRALLAELPGGADLTIAGVNSPRGVTIAGPIPSLNRLETLLNEREVFFRRLPLDYAFHSADMDVLQEPLRTALSGLRPEAGELPFYSTVSGGRLAGDLLDADYWWRNVRQPVQFADAIDTLLADGFNLFVEIGPHAVLRNYINEGLRAAGIDGRVIATLAREDDGLSRVHAAFCQSVIAGVPVESTNLFPVPGQLVQLPAYPWQRERFWLSPTIEGYDLINRRKEHPLLGYRLHENDAQWENQIDTALYPELGDHVVADAVVFPAACYAEMALAAASIWKPGHGSEIEELEIRAPLVLDDGVGKNLRFSIDGTDGRFRITSRERLSKEPWLLQAEGRILGVPAVAPQDSIVSIPDRPADVTGDEHYALAEQVGLSYGPAFRTVELVWRCGDHVTARLRQPVDWSSVNRLEPGALDGAFQLVLDLFAAEIGGSEDIAFVPVKIGRLALYRPGAKASIVQARLLRRGPRSVVCAFTLGDNEGALIAHLESVRFRGVLLRRPVVDHTGYLRFQLEPRPRIDLPRAPGLPALGDCAQVCRDHLHEPTRTIFRRRYYDEVEPLLDALCAAFARRLFEGMAATDELLLPETLIAEGRVALQQEAMLCRLVEMLQEDGLLEPSDGGWRWLPEVNLPDPSDIWISLLGDYPDYSAEVLMTGRAGMHLAEGLADVSRAAELAPQGCSSEALAHLLGASPSLSGVSKAVGELARLVMDELPTGNRLRILELNSCRSQFSSHILPHLDPRRCDYVIWVSSAQLVDEYEPVLASYPDIEIREFDFKREDSSAFRDENRGFDLVLLANELSDAEDADAVLGRLDDVIAPGGQIVLMEQRPSRWADLVFGLQPHWWSHDSQGRWTGRLRSPKAWLAMLQRHGFSQSTLVHDLPDSANGPYLILARRAEAPGVQAPSVASGSPRLWILVQDADGYSALLGRVLEGELRQAGQRVITATSAGGFSTRAPDVFTLDVTSAADHERVLRSVVRLHGEPDGVILLSGLFANDSTVDRPTAMEPAMHRCQSLIALLQACTLTDVRPVLSVLGIGSGALPRDLDELRSVVPEHVGGDAALWGLARTAINEFQDLRLRLIGLGDVDAVKAMAEGVSRELLHPDEEDEILLTATGRYVPRLRKMPVPTPVSVSSGDELKGHAEDVMVRLDFDQPGPLKNLSWRHQAIPTLLEDHIEISVRAAGLNFRDVMYAMGLLSDEALEQGFAGPHLGMELAGVVVRVGDRVAGIQPGDEVIAFAPASFANVAQTPATTVMAKPAGWSFEAAATVPTAFFTVYYALHHLARLQAGERVLIHGAAGGIGVAAVQFAKHLGAEVFATAGSEVKRDFVRLLGADHVMDSRSLAFADEVLRLTGGQGVDVVLNSLAGEAINRNLRVLRPFGRFLELGKRDYYENTRIGLRPFRNNITYFGIDADQLMSERPELAQRLFGELMQLFSDGALKPLPYRAFAAADVVDAFRYMQQSRQIGKVVLSFRDRLPAAPELGRVEQQGRLQLPADATYLVTGGLSGFGLQTAVWLAGLGARHLVLVSRRGEPDDEGRAAVESLRAQGVDVRAVACDVTDRAALTTLLQDIDASLPPLRGIVHAAMVIDDGLLNGLSVQQLESVFAPKILGACHLHELTLSHQLDFFVLYSSATTVFGNPGQANYVAANSYLEALAEARRARGLPAICVSWGAISDVGYLARHTDIRDALTSRMGGGALLSNDALAILERLLLSDTSGLAVLDLDWGTLRRFLPSSSAPKYQLLARCADATEGDADLSADIRRWVEELSPEALHDALADLLKREVGGILKIDPERLDEERSLYDLGMDSLMGLELVSAIEVRFAITLPIMAMSEGLTIAKLVERMVRQLRGADESGDDDMVLQVEQAGVAHSQDIAAEIGADDAREMAAEIAAAVDAEAPKAAHSMMKRS
ncbi:MAG: type I polyketide synthase [Woeseiaceae bacterium]|nr:type I polyketide synthase [Woeseiaceae bacterium]